MRGQSRFPGTSDAVSAEAGGKVLNLPDERTGRLTGHAGLWPRVRPRLVGLEQMLGWWRQALARRDLPGHPATLRVYAHFPFCAAQCRYCMYWRRRPSGPQQVAAHARYLAALIDRYGAALGRQVATTAYLGGGTPSLCSEEDLRLVLEAFGRAFGVEHEFTCEANVGSLTEGKLRLLAGAGVNRLSLGIQSLDQQVLALIGREVSPAERLAELVRAAQGLALRVNLDLVAGLPGQSASSFLSDLEQLLALNPEELCIYRYQPVAGLPTTPPPEMGLTALFDRRLRGRIERFGYRLGGGERDDDFGLFCRRGAEPARSGGRLLLGLERLGLRASGSASRYSLFDHPHAQLLGLGPGAFSHLFGLGWFREVSALSGLDRGAATVFAGTRLGLEDEARSLVLAELARTGQVRTAVVVALTGVDPLRAFGQALPRAVAAGLLVSRAGRLAWRSGATQAEQRALLEELAPLPEPPEATARLARSGPAALLLRQAEPELLPFSPEEQVGESVPTPAASGAAMARWLELLGWPASDPWPAGLSGRLVGSDELALQIEPAGLPELVVAVRPDRPGEPAFGRCGGFAISYRTRAGAPVTELELRRLRELVAATEKLSSRV